MHHGGDALHRLGPALVVEQIGFDQLEPVEGALPQFAQQRRANLFGPPQRTHRAAHAVAGLKQLQHRPLADETGRTGDEDEALIRHFTSPRLDRSRAFEVDGLQSRPGGYGMS